MKKHFHTIHPHEIVQIGAKDLIYSNSLDLTISHVSFIYQFEMFFRISASDIKTLRVYLGAHDIKSNFDGRSEHPVVRVIKQKDYVHKTLVNDIAILTLKTPVRISSTIKPVCLPTFHDSYEGQLVTVAGWGDLSERVGPPNELHEVDLHVWTNSRCASKYNHRVNGKIEPTMICAADDQKDSCDVSVFWHFLTIIGHFRRFLPLKT